MTTAVFILGTFAAVWGMMGLTFMGLPKAWLALPLAISTLLIVWAAPAVRAAAWSSPPNTRRLVGIWSGVEVAAMVVAVMLLNRAGHSDMIAPVLAMIVGAHLLPLAHGLQVRMHWITGFALIVAGVAALTLAVAERTVFAGLVSAAILWSSVAYLGYRARMGGRP
jgi:hypothetical protein